ncbi:solute carrier family 2, facilitated glucose transporter member 1-like isoform X2 [Oppia nitens]|uniref:solute carrier family 2, facilitated glucose transporter member 1-like isoform X2 n=1 Tax=Oppia nitens TaxID=1686743 RepID=UPI0023DACD4E|nr:solute carrier family 2, facilitated glucose transporter member 1-like isoform X2 [Oppia nitens]
MPHIRRSGLNSHLVFAISAAALGSSFQHGYNTGVVNAPQELVQKFIREAHRERFQDLTPLHDIFGNTTIGGHNSTTDTIGDDDLTTVNLIYSIMVSIFCIGGMIGALLTGYVAEKFGRKGGLLWNNVFVFLAAGLMGFSKVCRSYEMLIMGRFFIGFNAGLNAGLAPMYLTEISPTNMRGAIGTIYQLVITISIFTSNLLGLPQVLGTEDKWPILFAVTIVPAIFTLATLPMCPESPKYILIFQNKDVQAQRALTWLRGTIEVHDEMDDMRAEYESMKLVPKVTLHELWYNSMLRQPLIIALVVMLSQQFSGINAVIFFSTSIFEKAGLNKSAALYATLGIGVINVLMTIVSLVLVEKSGRKTLLLTGLGGMMFTTIVLTFCLALKDTFESLSYVSILAVYVFIVMFASGPGSIPWFLVAELFGVGARAMATSIAVSVNWTANFVVGLAFLPLQETMGGYVFVIFTVLLALFWLFVYKKVPETKGKTVEEIAAAFRQKAYQ